MTDIKAKLAKTFEVPIKFLEFQDTDGSEIPDWCSIPSCVTLVHTSVTRTITLDVHVPQREASFSLKLSSKATQHEVETKLASI